VVEEFTDELYKFLQVTLGSVWALELMMTLRREPRRAWSTEALTAEMRASLPLVTSLIARFERGGVVAVTETGQWIWRPLDARVEELAAAAADAYAVAPFRVTRTITGTPNREIQQFAEAFRLKPNRKPD
jgi:hypothetical protein